MYKIYLAGDLFDHKHLAGNYLLAKKVEQLSNGLYTFDLAQDWEKGKGFVSPVDIRNKHFLEIITSDMALFNFDGVDLDSGTVAEFMFAKMLDIPAVILRTDIRNGAHCFDGDWNAMVVDFPRCTVAQHESLMLYNEVGYEQMQQTIAQSVVAAFDEVRTQEPLLKTHEELVAAYRHVIKMCGSGFDKMVPEKELDALLCRKMKKCNNM